MTRDDILRMAKQASGIGRRKMKLEREDILRMARQASGIGRRKMKLEREDILRMALEALDSDNPDIQLRAAIALRAALEAPEPEPRSCLDRADIIRMAREAGIRNDCDGIWCEADQLERFAALVTEENDKKWQSLLVKWDEYFAVCNKGIKLSSDLSLAAIDVATAVEREACVSIVYDAAQKFCRDGDSPPEFKALIDCAAAIRERGEE